MPVGLSRWTMAYFATALGAFLLAQLLMAAGVTYPLEPLTSGRTLVGVHLITIGWLTLLMIGALLQFVPVITGTTAIGARAGLPSLIAIGAGLLGMIVGFLSLDGTVPAALAPALPLGGGCVILGVLLVGVTIARTLAAGRPLALPGRFVAVSLCFLLLTVSLGFGFALAFAWPGVFPWAALLARGFEVHVVTGLVGWFTLTAMGVSYRLLSMFMLAPEDDSGIGPWVLRIAAAGLALLWLGAFIDAEPAGRLLKDACSALLVLAAALYLVDMARMYRARRRRALELNSKAAAAALAALAAGAVGLIAVEAMGSPEAMIGPLCYLVLFGWLSGLALAQLYKIVPFLTWLERYGPRLGKGPVPRVQDLVNERRAAPWFVVYFLAVAAGTAAGALGLVVLWRVAILVHLLASILIARELWRARHLRYVAPASRARPFPGSQALSGSTSLSP